MNKEKEESKENKEEEEEIKEQRRFCVLECFLCFAETVTPKNGHGSTLLRIRDD
jgi:hypothetical protein